MIRSLGIKLLMLAGTLGLLLALEWNEADYGAQAHRKLEGAKMATVQDLSTASGTGERKGEDVRQDSINPHLGTASDRIPPSSNTDAIDLNRSTSKELETLPGIGPILASRIIAYRNEFGGFHAIEELDRVKGIGMKKLQTLRPLVRISQPS